MQAPQNLPDHKKQTAAFIKELAAEGGASLTAITTPVTSQFRFHVDDIPFYASYAPNPAQNAQPNDSHLQIWAILGNLPYSVEAPEKRKMLVKILNGIPPLPDMKIGINDQQQIVVMMDCSHTTIHPHLFIFPPLAQFMQSARSYISLIGQYI